MVLTEPANLITSCNTLTNLISNTVVSTMLRKGVARNGQLFKICQMLFNGKKEAGERNREM
jgi:hypothetical protein